MAIPFLERVGRSVDHFIQRRLTPPEEKDALEIDLAQQELEASERKMAGKNIDKKI
ncbi:hypothetical protein HY439_02740 [Candidatus Microgenomates bacterium]|nr:hypothetical protein [Candidatus Microgenomates bacterium]